ncbi:MAG: transposase [Bacteroidota bacterium]
MNSIREKAHRLPLHFYRGQILVAFTACLRDRLPYFVSERSIRPVEEILLGEAQRFQTEAEIFLFMPEHLHVILRGTEDTSDAYCAMKMFKQKSGFWLAHRTPAIWWQKDFYDHILRSEEKLEIHVRYILENPLRAGLVDRWQDYPFKGSTVHNIDRWR